MFHLINLTGAQISFENLSINEVEKRNSFAQKTPTTTLPFLETKDGNISESKAIGYYLCQKYKPELLGQTVFEKAKINQWIEFACCEICRCYRSIIYPIFGWSEYCQKSFNEENAKLKEYIKILDKELASNEFIAGNKLTLADVLLFRYLRLFMMLHFPEGMRKSLLPNVTKWFEKIMKSKEAIQAYGRTILCKIPMKPFTEKINRNVVVESHEKEENNGENGNKKDKKEKKENKEKIDKKENNEKKEKKGKKEKKEKQTNHAVVLEKKKEKKEYVPSMLELPRFNIKEKENNPLDALPESKFDLESFKKKFMSNSNLKGAMRDFWKTYDPEGYSLWHIEYKNEPSECITLFRTVIIKGDILLQLKYFKKYCFGTFGVYGQDGDYQISGCLMWRGQEIPDEIKEINCYDKLVIRKLNPKEKRDQQLVHDYWTHIKEN